MRVGNKKEALNCKVLVVGKSNVGKSHLLLRYVQKDKSAILLPRATVQVDFQSCIEIVDGTEVKLTIWDTAGSEKYRPMLSSYFKSAKAAVLVFDLTDDQSLIEIKYWIQQLNLQCGRNIFKILVGNKSDLVNESDSDPKEISRRQQIEDLIEEYCKDYGMAYVKTSALEGTNVDLVFNQLAKGYLENQKQFKQSESLGFKTSSSMQQPASSQPATTCSTITLANNNNNEQHKKQQQKSSCC